MSRAKLYKMQKKEVKFEDMSPPVKEPDKSGKSSAIIGGAYSLCVSLARSGNGNYCVLNTLLVYGVGVAVMVLTPSPSLSGVAMDIASIVSQKEESRRLLRE